ncbi:FAST kinase domain-containing protein 3, mitochondrial-like [Ptychodera flava]|uniref:FAST kinase domain-containing protein 3, mitochondrial-like n=1 Tax=Ptychodera flava TaxID=63121 RepID=UPI003969EECB
MMMLIHFARRLLQPSLKRSPCIVREWLKTQTHRSLHSSVTVTASNPCFWKSHHFMRCHPLVSHEHANSGWQIRHFHRKPSDTLLKIIVNSPTVENVFQLISQNPSKVFPHHIAIAMAYAISLCKRSDQPMEFQNWPVFELMCSHLALHCPDLQNKNLVEVLQCMMILHFPHDHVLFVAVTAECNRRVRSLSLIDLSKVLEYLNIMQAREHPLREACAKHIEQQLDEVTNHRTIVPLLSYYRDEYAGYTETSISEESDQDARFSVISQHLVQIIKIFLKLNKSPMRTDIFKIGDLAAFTMRWQKCNPDLLGVLLENHAFFYFRHDKFIQSLSYELPQHIDSIPQRVFELLAKYLSHHAVRSAPLLESLSQYIVQRDSDLGLDDLQRLILPIGKLNYLPENYEEFFSMVEEVILKDMEDSPVATVNVMMSLAQMRSFPIAVLDKMFTQEFVNRIFDGSYQFEDIKLKLCLIDQAVEFDFPTYDGPRLPADIKVSAFYNTDQSYHQKNNPYLGHVKTAIDEIVGGEDYYLYQPVLAPGCYADFELHIDRDGNFLVLSSGRGANQISENSMMSPDHSTNPIVSSVSDDKDDSQWYSSHGLEANHKPEKSEQNIFTKKLSRYHLSHSETGNEAFYKPIMYDNEENNDEENSQIGNETFYSSYGKSDFTMKFPTGSSQMFNVPKPVYGYSSDVIPDGSKNMQNGGEAIEATDELHSGGSDMELEFLTKSVSHGQLDGVSELVSLRPQDDFKFRRVLVLVQDKMFFCNNSEILLSRQAMQIRHLCKIGYDVIQVNYFDLDKLETMADLKTYLHEKIFSSEAE